MNEPRRTRAGRQFANTASTSSLEESGTELFSRSSSTETIISRESTVTDEETSERLGQKLNRLNNKAARYESHKQFLENCIQEKLIPEGLRLQLEPTIGNYDDEFLHNWYVKLEKFSLELMTDVVDFCDKTLVSTGKSIIETEAELKTKIEAKEFASVRETIALNKEETSKALQIRKKRKYRNLKYRRPRESRNPEASNPEDRRSRSRSRSTSRRDNSQQKQRSYAEVASNIVWFVPKNNDQNNSYHPKEKLSQRLRNNTRRNESESQKNRTNPIPKNPTAASGNGGLDMTMLNTVFQGLSQTTKAIAELENNFKTLLEHCQTQMEQ